MCNVFFLYVLYFSLLCFRLMGEGETERDTVDRDFDRTRIFVLLYLIGRGAIEEVATVARAMLFDLIIILI